MPNDVAISLLGTQISFILKILNNMNYLWSRNKNIDTYISTKKTEPPIKFIDTKINK